MKQYLILLEPGDRIIMKPESYRLLRADVKATVMGNKYRSVGLTMKVLTKP